MTLGRLLFGATLALFGCDAIAPERTINDAAGAPEVVAFEALRSDLAYAGVIEVEAPARSEGGGGPLVVLFVDGERANDCTGPPCTIGLDTRNYEEGPHELTLTYLRPGSSSASIGLGALLGLGPVLLRDTVTFDQSPPVPVEIVASEWTPFGVRLRWWSPPGTNRNARAYRILARRYGEQVGESITVAAPGQEVVDTQFELRMGDRLSYEVSVTNGVSLGSGGSLLEATSQPRTVLASPEIEGGRFCGEALDDPVSRMIPFATQPGFDRLLGLCYIGDEAPAIRALTLSTRTYGPIVELGAPPGGGTFFFDLLSEPGGSAFVFARTTSVPLRYFASPLDPADLSLGSWVELVSPNGWGLNSSGVVVGPDGRLFAKDHLESVHVFDSNDGSYLQTVVEAASAGTQTTGLQRVGLSGLLVYRPGERLLVDMTAQPATIAIRSRTTEFPFERPAYATDATGRIYRHTSSPTIDVVDSATLQRLRSFDVSGGAPVVQLWGGLDGVYAMTYDEQRSFEVVRLAPDGTEIGRRASVPIHQLVPTSTPGEVFVHLGGVPPFIDTVAR